ncbi:MAG: hypothetical protein M3O15_11870, partial [Acidobacteriota bacterium]|nr:hypothetical protein [Acidobacteriota bacterium]
YDRLLAAFGLRDDQVAAAYSPSPVARFVWRTLLHLLLRLPLALAGILLNWPTYRLVGAVAGRVQNEPDQPASYKVFGGLLLFPLTWLAEAVLGAWRGGRWVGLALLLAAPLTGWVALLFDERRARFWEEARAYLVLRTRGRLRAELKASREAAGREVAALAALYQAEAGGEGGPER